MNFNQDLAYGKGVVGSYFTNSRLEILILYDLKGILRDYVINERKEGKN